MKGHRLGISQRNELFDYFFLDLLEEPMRTMKSPQKVSPLHKPMFWEGELLTIAKHVS